MKRFDQLAAHHSNLLARCAVQRRQLGATRTRSSMSSAAWIAASAASRRVLRNPALIGGASRSSRWSGRGG